jgi:UDP-N-acetylmuramate dehydrogenase
LQSLSQLHTFGLAAQAPFIIEFNDIQQILEHQCVQDAFVILGEGSNTVFTEDYYGEVWVNKLRGMVFSEDTVNHYIEVASGENWHRLVSTCVDREIGGFENLALIPGTVGAAPIQNIGAYGVEVGTYVDSVEYINLATRTMHSISGEDCAFGYRDSIFKHALKDKVFISKVNFCIPKSVATVTSYGELAALTTPSISAIYEKVIQIRQQKLPDPNQIGNAGSFFKNPVISQQHFSTLQARFPLIPSYPVSKDSVKVPAGWLIDTLGFKGKIIDGIQCHPQQALVLTNIASGTGSALVSFAREIIAQVSTHFGITLEHEVQLLGRSNRITL